MSAKVPDADASKGVNDKKKDDEVETPYKTVKLNVGGRHFEVSRSLMEQNSNSLLSKLVSNTWRERPEKPIFIDRSGDIFAWVLEYLRYGCVEFPSSVPASIFDREMDYYGITRTTGDNITQRETIFETTESILEEFELTAKNYADSKTRRDMFAIASYIQYLFVTGETKLSLHGECPRRITSHGILSTDEVEIINSYLVKHFRLFITPVGGRSCSSSFIIDKFEKQLFSELPGVKWTKKETLKIEVDKLDILRIGLYIFLLILIAIGSIDMRMKLEAKKCKVV